MIPTLEQIQPGELFTGWLAHIADINGVSANELYTDFLYCRVSAYKNLLKPYLYKLELFDSLDAYSELMPSLTDILRYHTMFYMNLPFFSNGVQAKELENTLRSEHVGTLSVRSYFNAKAMRVCPLCAEEDMQEHGRVIIRVIHQWSSCCVKHKVKLVLKYTADVPSCEIIAASIDEQSWNSFYQSLYDDPVITDANEVFDLLYPLINQESPQEQSAFTNCVYRKKLHPEMVFNILTRNGMQLNHCKSRTPSSSEFQIEDGRHYPVLYVRCLRCNHTFWTHAYSIEISIPCPSCRKSMNVEAVMERIIPSVIHADKSYTAYSLPRSMINNWEYKEPGSDKCYKKKERVGMYKKPASDKCNKRKERVGMSFSFPNMETFTITEYQDCNHITVADSNGIQYKSTYKAMRNGRFPKEYIRRHPEIFFKWRFTPTRHPLHIGENKKLPNGDVLTITAYQNYDSIEVSSALYGDTFRYSYNLWSTRSYPLSYLKKHPNGVKGITQAECRLGQKTILPTGETMEIVRYDNYNRIILQFSDGYCFPSNYSNFKNHRLPRGYLSVHPELRDYSKATKHNIKIIGSNRYETADM